jgi:hypothetical protein
VTSAGAIVGVGWCSLRDIGHLSIQVIPIYCTILYPSIPIHHHPSSNIQQLISIHMSSQDVTVASTGTKQSAVVLTCLNCTLKEKPDQACHHGRHRHWCWGHHIYIYVCVTINIILYIIYIYIHICIYTYYLYIYTHMYHIYIYYIYVCVM